MEMTICKTSQEDIKKMGFLIAILFMSFNISLDETNSVYVAVFIQGLSNLETFWDIRKNQFLHKKTKGLVTFIIGSSFAAGLLAIGNWYNSYSWMECLCVKCFFMIVVMLPVLIWARDFYLNNKAGR